MKATLESRGVQTVENQHWESIIGLFGKSSSLMVGEGHLPRAESEALVAYFI